MRQFRGVYPAIVTPFTDAGVLNREAIEKLVAFQLDAGVDGFYVGGATGECLLQDVPTRAAMAKRVVDEVRGRAKVIVHVAACTTADAVTLAREAADAGADAVAALPPIFYKVGFDGIHRYYRAIAEAVDVPTLVYYLPALSGVAFSREEIGRLLEIPGVCGLKFSDYNLFLLHSIREHYPQATVFSGNDEVFLPALVMGTHGSIGMTLNFMPEIYVGLYRAYGQGDLAEAQRLQFQANRVIEILLRYGSFGATKAILKMRGIDCGQPREPLMPLEDSQYESLQRELEAIQFIFSPSNRPERQRHSHEQHCHA